jgi:hypothetical protein
MGRAKTERRRTTRERGTRSEATLARREKILAAALQSFHDLGYERTRSPTSGREPM